MDAFLSFFESQSSSRHSWSFHSTSGSCFDETLKKLSGISLQDAAKEYGLKKPQSGKKFPAEASRPRDTRYTSSSALDDLMLVKDPRTISARKKKHVARFPQPPPPRFNRRFRRRIVTAIAIHRRL
ncbi:unnamed protein product [Camellia sinensis]